MKPSQIITLIICISLILITAGCTDSTDTPSKTTPEKSTPTTIQNAGTPSGQNLTVNFLDVGQGDSILLEYNGKAMLIDAGDQGEVVSDYLKNQAISTLDYIIFNVPNNRFDH
jgi:competence protein ComEC